MGRTGLPAALVPGLLTAPAAAWDVRLNADYGKVMSPLPPDSVRLLRDA
ncbi:hypothetical protein ACI7BZ_17890 [Xanthobacter sp. AM11]